MKSFSQKILNWFKLHGRTHLPWQNPATPYRVWISEIMLQQTQVNTVIPYFEKFIQNFPNLNTLAKAELDEVLAHWSGLGYYARARNLHKTAQLITELPNDLDALQQLPGIGRSTAGAILSLGLNQYAPILDGNVKRVLARVYGVNTWSGETRTLKQLWAYSEELTPKSNTAQYNQAMMDLGSMICTRSKPLCEQCPLTSNCQAYNNNIINQCPGKKPKKTLPIKSTRFIIYFYNNKILLKKRPEQGLWGGLWCFPEDNNIKSDAVLPSFRHTFTHFHLDITPCVIRQKPNQSAGQQWFELDEILALGIPKPIRKIILMLSKTY